MANTKKLVNVLASGTTAVVYLTLAYVDAQETNYVVYDSSVIAGILGITDPLTCTLLSVRASTNTAAGLIKLNWDASTPVLAMAIPPGPGGPLEMCFRDIGGLKNQGGSGITGDITLTTTGLASGESIAIVLIVRVD